MVLNIVGARKQKEATELQLVKRMLDAGVPLKIIREIPRDKDYVRKVIDRIKGEALEDFREEEGI